ncbi:MAG: ketopantoate reductase family protein [Pseudorhodoplanes sp.]
MRICIYGAGASGGHFAIKLARAGHDVSVIARGPHLTAIREKGLQLRTGDQVLSATVAAGEKPADFGPQDAVIVATKATALPSIAAQIAPLVGKDTLVVFPQNGMTWWYPVGLPAQHPAPPAIPIFDLAKPFLAAMRPDQVIGGIIYSANEVEAPGIIKNNSPTFNKLEIAAIDQPGATRDALQALRADLETAGIQSPDPGDIRVAVWTKLVNNMSGSTIGLATASPSDGARKDPALAEIYCRVMGEGLSISAAHGYALDIEPRRMLKRLLDHKASILQDYEQHRPMEIAEIVLAPVAFARAANIATPTLDTIAAIVTKLARDRGLLPAEISGPSLATS